MVENRVPLKYSTNCTGMIQPSATQNFFIITYLSAVMHTNQCFNKNSWVTITKQICVKKHTLWHISHCFQLPRIPAIIRTINDPIHVGRFYQVHIHVGRLLSGSYKCYILLYDFVIHDLFHNSVLYISYWSFLILMLVLIKKKIQCYRNK